MRFPHACILHQRRVWFLLVSRKSQRQLSAPQARTSAMASEVMSCRAASASIQTGSSASALKRPQCHRSEERRVGKECRARGSVGREKKKKGKDHSRATGDVADVEDGR